MHNKIISISTIFPFAIAALALLLVFLDLKYIGNYTDFEIAEHPVNKQDIKIAAYMCQTQDCESIYNEIIANSNTSVYCALFDFNLNDMNNLIQDKKVKKLLLVDSDNRGFNDSYIIYDNRTSYMHNKFCVVDSNITITGSFNPTLNDRDRNDNNIVVIQSQEISDIYTNYFKEIVKEHTIKGYKTNMTKNYELSSGNNAMDYNISICFSRGGNCNSVIAREIMNASKSVYFMTFSLTDDAIGNNMIIKHYTNVSIKGAFEKTLISEYSQYGKMLHQGTDVIKDCNSKMLHHKVFIIDNNTVITGSFNPGSNADNSNDENLIIIRNKDIATEFLKEFERVNKLCNEDENNLKV